MIKNETRRSLEREPSSSSIEIRHMSPSSSHIKHQMAKVVGVVKLVHRYLTRWFSKQLHGHVVTSVEREGIGEITHLIHCMYVYMYIY